MDLLLFVISCSLGLLKAGSKSKEHEQADSFAVVALLVVSCAFIMIGTTIL
jgi:hypothetical protein